VYMYVQVSIRVSIGFEPRMHHERDDVKNLSVCLESEGIPYPSVQDGTFWSIFASAPPLLIARSWRDATLHPPEVGFSIQGLVLMHLHLHLHL